jgi:hypothetical protein
MSEHLNPMANYVRREAAEVLPQLDAPPEDAALKVTMR